MILPSIFFTTLCILPPHARLTIYLMRLRMFSYDTSSLLFSKTSIKDRAFPLMIYTFPNTYMGTKHLTSVSPFFLMWIVRSTHHYYNPPSSPNKSMVKNPPRSMSPIVWHTHRYYTNPDSPNTFMVTKPMRSLSPIVWHTHHY